MGWALAVYGTVSRLMVGSLPKARFAEYLLVLHAQANLATIPPEVTDEQAVLLADIASTGFAGAEAASRSETKTLAACGSQARPRRFRIPASVAQDDSTAPYYQPVYHICICLSNAAHDG
jgi:hypothetical protein